MRRTEPNDGQDDPQDQIDSLSEKRLARKDILLQGQCRGFGAVADVELLENATDVVAYCGGAEEEDLRDFLVGFAFDQEDKDFAFTGGRIGLEVDSMSA